ncbi:hypothetical protein CLAIMM_05745 [Cladophialophora immunda]|nr:hypothetical protein CLAIMM_05745 [Cladophialophora immunda]
MASTTVLANGASAKVKVPLNIPSSSTSVSVKLIDVSSISNVAAEKLYAPQVTGYRTCKPVPSFSFLIEHPSGTKVLFDLGIRKDWQNMTPAIVKRIKECGYQPSSEKDVSEVLGEGGIDKDNINAVIWSHAHWDHTGDVSTFGPRTDLVVGRGFKDHFLGGDENSALGGISKSDYEGRNLREITFQEAGVVQIGQFSASDYFGDGSLYLLDTPGHCVGHLCALVRTTTSPDTFLFLGGDAAHHCGEFRPSTYQALPEQVVIEIQQQQVPFCPCSWYEDLQVSRGRDPKGPLWQPAIGHDMDKVLETIRGMQEFDGDENIFVILAHDAALRVTNVPFFPECLNDWKARELGRELKWKWLGDIVEATLANSVL